MREVRLAGTGRSDEEEHADRPARVLETGASAAHRARDHRDRRRLADDLGVQHFLHAEQLLRLLLGEAADRDAGPHRDDLGDVLVGHLGALLRLREEPVGLRLLQLVLLRALLLTERRGELVLLRLHRLVLVGDELVELLLGVLHVGRKRRVTKADAARGLVHEVDGLVREEAVGDVASGELRRRLHRLVGDRDLVVVLVLGADPREDRDRLLDRRLADHDRLEPALEGGVALDVLAELVERRRADALQLAARERRLEDVRGVDRALGRAGTDERVQLVDEQDDVVRVTELLDDLLEALLELAAVLRAGDERADVERQHALSLQRLGHVALDDAVREALGDRGLADARLADERRVVLRAAAEDLDDALDLLLAADDRIELLRLGHRREVHAELVERRRLRAGGLAARGRRLGRRRVLLAERRDDLVADLLERNAERLEHARGDPLAFAHETEEQVLGADVAVAELASLVDRELDDLLRAWRKRDLAGRRRGVAAADDELDRRADLRQLDAERVQNARRDAFALADQPEEEVLRSDVVVVETDGLVLGKREHSLRAVVEAVERTHLKLFYHVYRCRHHLVPIIRSGPAVSDLRTTFHVRSARRADRDSRRRSRSTATIRTRDHLADTQCRVRIAPRSGPTSLTWISPSTPSATRANAPYGITRVTVASTV